MRNHSYDTVWDCWNWPVLPHCFGSLDLHVKDDTTVFEIHSMSFPGSELSLFNDAGVNSVFQSMAPLNG